MIQGGQGGANTHVGLKFEKEVDFQTLLEKVPHYEIKPGKQEFGKDAFFKGSLVARCFKKHDFYKFLTEHGVDGKALISKKLLPDDALFVLESQTLFIIEIKFQAVAGSVDEKLQTCDFKKKQYIKMLNGTGVKIEYVYVLNDWFKKPEYRDVLEYINSVGCHYVFNCLPLAFINLPAE